jgi:uncharacterized DUF497 family protein
LTADFIVDTVNPVEVTFDPAKDAENIIKHGVSLQRAEEFDFDSARLDLDDSQDYGEERWNLIGWLDARLYALTVVFLETSIRAISLRKAEKAEHKIYAERY